MGNVSSVVERGCGSYSEQQGDGIFKYKQSEAHNSFDVTVWFFFNAFIQDCNYNVEFPPKEMSQALGGIARTLSGLDRVAVALTPTGKTLVSSRVSKFIWRCSDELCVIATIYI